MLVDLRYVRAYGPSPQGSTSYRTFFILFRNLINLRAGLHQGLALSPYLFTLIIGELAAHIQEEVLWCTLLADDILLMDELRDGLNAKLERCREASKSKGFEISHKDGIYEL